MFGPITDTTNIPENASTAYTHDERALIEILGMKRKYIDIINHLSSIPHTDDHSLQLDSKDSPFIKNINETITTCINNMNNLSEVISELKFRCITEHYFQAKREMINMFTEFVSSLPNRNELISTYSNWLAGPSTLFRKEKKIYEIASDIYKFLETKEPIKFMYTSPFLKCLYLKCIMAIVICVPFHDMKNIKHFFNYFDNNIHEISTKILLFFHSLIDSVESTPNEWGEFRDAHTYDSSIDPYHPPLRLDIATIDNSEIQHFCYPKVEYKYSDECNLFIQAKYHTSMVMHEICSIIHSYYISPADIKTHTPTDDENDDFPSDE